MLDICPVHVQAERWLLHSFAYQHLILSVSTWVKRILKPQSPDSEVCFVTRELCASTVPLPTTCTSQCMHACMQSRSVSKLLPLPPQP